MGETLTYLQVKRWGEVEGASDTALVIVRSRSSRRIRHVMGRVLNRRAFLLTSRYILQSLFVTPLQVKLRPVKMAMAFSNLLRTVAYVLTDSVPFPG